MSKMNFSANVMNVFSEMGTDYETMNNLMQDVALGREIYDDENQRVISKAEANAKILEFSHKILGIDNVKDRTQIRRGLRDHGREWFDIIEDTVNIVITVGLQEDEWFNNFVEMKTIAYGDRADFYSETDALFAVAKAGETHHDHVLQRLQQGQTMPVPTYRYAVKIGADINRYITGDVDWSKMIVQIAKSYVAKTQEEVLAALDTAVNKLPVPAPFIGTGALSAATKDNFDAIIANVSAANDGADVAIYGTKMGLKKLNALADVDWASMTQKEAMTNTGILGTYEGTNLVVVPQRFKDLSMSAKVFNDKKLFFMPMVD